MNDSCFIGVWYVGHHRFYGMDDVRVVIYCRCNNHEGVTLLPVVSNLLTTDQSVTRLRGERSIGETVLSKRSADGRVGDWLVLTSPMQILCEMGLA